MIDCEDGYCIGNRTKATFFDRSGREIKVFNKQVEKDIVSIHLDNFITAVNSRDTTPI